MQKIVLGHLDDIFIKQPFGKRRHCSLQQAKNSCAVLLSLLIHADRQPNTRDAFNHANKELGGLDIQLIAEEDLSLSKLNDALDELARLFEGVDQLLDLWHGRDVGTEHRSPGLVFCRNGYGVPRFGEVEHDAFRPDLGDHVFDLTDAHVEVIGDRAEPAGDGLAGGLLMVLSPFHRDHSAGRANRPYECGRQRT